MPRAPFKIRDRTTFREFRGHFRNHDYPAFPDDATFLDAFGPKRLRDIFEPQLTPPGFTLPQGCQCMDPAFWEEYVRHNPPSPEDVAMNQRYQAFIASQELKK